VIKGSDKCVVKTARCTEFCFDSANQERCNCENPDYPNNWVGKTCLYEIPGESSRRADNPRMRMAGEKEVAAFDEQNRIRRDPLSIQRTI